MASVTSLGLHEPIGLQYAIQERLLPQDPTSSEYKWQNYVDSDGKSVVEDDELLVTSRCVIWSRGGLFRKSYRFDLEKEPVTHALLTSFPSVGPLASKDEKSAQNKGHSSNRAKAIVVFLKTQAHIYFLSGTSHVIHLPFEVESAFAAPNGLIIQRKLRVDNLVAASLKFPRVPPNSFVSSQPQPWSAASSQLSTFSIADLGAPKQMPMHTSTLKDMWDPSSLKSDANWPRLFSLSDPLAELGLVVPQSAKSEGIGRQRSSNKITSLDTAEEILHITHRGEFSHVDSEHPLILALTLNRETSIYNVWRLSYAEDEVVKEEQQRVTSGTLSRRRSSFVPGTVTGATTPVLGAQQTFRDSFGGNPPGLVTKKNRQDESRDKVTDFVSSLDPDLDHSTTPRRKSRRVSSMLARADLSATHERSAFSDTTAHQVTTARRGESLGSQYGRTSIGPLGVANGPSFSQPPQFNQSLNSFLEAPVDDLLDELRAGGDFEGFHNMGLDDEEFDALRQEVILSKVCGVPAEHNNVRYSSQNLPATSQCKVFTLTAPPSAADDQGNTIVICVLDSDEKNLLVLTLYIKTHKVEVDLNGNHTKGRKPDSDVNVVTLGSVMRAKGVIDACRLDDGQVSRILVLTETSDGYGELSLQAPWSALMKVPLPAKFTMNNIRSLGHGSTPTARREGGFKRVLSQGPRALRGLRNSKHRGLFDLIDDEGKMHQLQVLLQPRNPQASKILEVCRAVVPGSTGEGVLVGWWNVMQWLRLESIDTVDLEWTALVIILFSMVLSLSTSPKPSHNRTHTKRKSRTGYLRSISGAQSDMKSWEIMLIQETANGNPLPAWADNAGWKWLTENDDPAKDCDILPHIFTTHGDNNSFLPSHVKLAKDFVTSSFGHEVMSGCLPTSGNRNLEIRKAALVDTFVGLHLLREEQKLDTMTSDYFTTGVASLSPILSQIARWLGWPSWVQTYEVEGASLFDLEYDSESSIDSPLSQPFECPAIYDWIQTCLTTRSFVPFKSLPELVASRSPTPRKTVHGIDQWTRLTPRTLLFIQFFTSMELNWSSVQFVEALSSAGMDPFLLETLPEAVLAPLKDAIVHCQTEPPTSWSKDLLAIVGREDINMLLTPGQRPFIPNPLYCPFHMRQV